MTLKLVLYPIAVMVISLMLQRGTCVVVDLAKKFYEFLLILNKAGTVIIIGYYIGLAYFKLT